MRNCATRDDPCKNHQAGDCENKPGIFPAPRGHFFHRCGEASIQNAREKYHRNAPADLPIHRVSEKFSFHYMRRELRRSNAIGARVLSENESSRVCASMRIRDLALHFTM